MKIKLTKDCSDGKRTRKAGEVLNLSKRHAQAIVQTGKAVVHKEEKLASTRTTKEDKQRTYKKRTKSK